MKTASKRDGLVFRVVKRLKATLTFGRAFFEFNLLQELIVTTAGHQLPHDWIEVFACDFLRTIRTAYAIQIGQAILTECMETGHLFFG